MPQGSLDDEFGRDIGFTVYGAGAVVGALGLRVEVARNQFTPDGVITDACEAAGFRCDSELRFTSFSGGIQYGAMGTGMLGLDNARILPYAFATIGFYRLQIEEGFDEQTKLGLSGGAGLNLRIGKRWGIQGDLHLYAVRQDDDAEDWLYFVTPQAGIWVSF